MRDLPTRIGINAMGTVVVWCGVGGDDSQITLRCARKVLISEASVLMLIMNDIQKQARANLTDRTRWVTVRDVIQKTIHSGPRTDRCSSHLLSRAIISSISMSPSPISPRYGSSGYGNSIILIQALH